ncbi:gp598 [Bacillus phage G]|uniref:Gp598 n=1 Tax=Bacillus phage G TaxID=2884420 RepID=G3MAX8_9CAUD|nr:gp598 [Bacillus phage G]AEO93843.1 gp598 [Bacillus phage G]
MKINNVSAQDKRKFLRIMLDKLDFSKRDFAWVKDFLLHRQNYAKTLKKIHFVDNPEGLNNIIILSDKYKLGGTALHLVTDNTIITDVDQINEMINEATARKRFYLYVNTDENLMKFESFINIVLDNNKAKMPEEYVKAADDIIAQAMKEAEIQQLSKKIDEALDDNDKELFYDYTNQLKELRK